jgi:precorrin-4/cobalt-precorrin-4 C11-methyltransferase
LTPVYGADCPAAVVVRASWPDEQVLRAPLDQIAERVAALGVERTALVFVGRALAAEGFRDSALYDGAHRRRFRGGDQP